MSTFRVKTLTTALSEGYVGRLSDGMNQFFGLNYSLTVVDLHFSFRRQGQRAQRLAHLVYNDTPNGQTPAAFPGGARYYAAEFQDNPGGLRATQKAATFFAANTQFKLVLARFQPPETNNQTYLFRRSLLVIYTAVTTLFAVNTPQVVGIQPPALAVGAVSRAGILGAPTDYPQALMNAGGDPWPAGAPAPGIKQVDGLLLSNWAGIAPQCYDTVTVPPNSTTPPPSLVPCKNCCLRAAWDCVWNGSASIWVLDANSVECVSNGQCSPAPVVTCT